MYFRLDNKELVWGSGRDISRARSLRKRAALWLPLGIALAVIGLVVAVGVKTYGIGSHAGENYWATGGFLVFAIGVGMMIRSTRNNDTADALVRGCLVHGTAIRTASFSYRILAAKLMNDHELDLTTLLRDSADYDQLMLEYTRPAARMEQTLADEKTAPAVINGTKADARRSALMTSNALVAAVLAKAREQTA